MIYKMDGSDKQALVTLGGGVIDEVESNIDEIKKELESVNSTDSSLKDRISALENGLKWTKKANVTSKAGDLGTLTWDVIENDYMKMYTTYWSGRRFLAGSAWYATATAWYVPDEVTNTAYTWRWADAYSYDGAIYCTVHIFGGGNIGFASHNRYGGASGSNYDIASNFFILSMKH